MKRNSVTVTLSLALAAILLTPSAFAQISLGRATSFGVLAGTTVTNTGATVVHGNVGVSPGSAVTGFNPPGTVIGGTIYAADPGGVAAGAQADLTVAYNAIQDPIGTPCNVDLTGQNLGGLVLTPGVYCFSSSAFLTGTLTLNMQGNPSAAFLFKTGSTLTTAPGSSVILINSGGTTCPPNIFWQIGSSAVLDTTTAFVGNILALTTISLNTGATLNGRALARNGAVNLQTNTVSICAPALACPIITVNPASLPNGSLGTAYNQTVAGSGGVAPYTFAVTSGTLPSGLALNSGTGAITGIPLTVGTSNFTITATDANGCPGSRAFTIIIAAVACPVITLSPPTLPPGTVGSLYGQFISGSGGASPYTFAITSGSLPNGLTLNTTNGLISGTPLTPGLFSFTLKATDNGGCPGSAAYSILIAAAAPAGAIGGPTLDFAGLTVLVILLAGAGLFIMNKSSL